MQLPEQVYVAKNKLRRAATHAVRRVGGKPRVIATLTSYPARIGTVNVAIQSLLAQTYLPDLIVLYLCKDEFPRRKADLPVQLRAQLSHDVQVRWVDLNLKPHKKYFWAMQEFNDDIIITFDDDLIYRKELIAELMATYARYPHAIAAARTHYIVADEAGAVAPYNDWPREIGRKRPDMVGKPSMQLFATTGAGALYPPHIMPEATFDAEHIQALCPTADDIWMKCMQLVAGVPVVASTPEQYLIYIPDSQEEGLLYNNIDAGANDQQFAATVAHCNELAGADITKRIYDRALTELFLAGVHEWDVN